MPKDSNSDAEKINPLKAAIKPFELTLEMLTGL